MCQNEARFVPPRHLLGGTTRSMMTLATYARTRANWLPRSNLSTPHTIRVFVIMITNYVLSLLPWMLCVWINKANMFMWQEFHPMM